MKIHRRADCNHCGPPKKETLAMDSKPYRVRLKKSDLQGPRRRVSRFQSGPATFFADQIEPSAYDYPDKPALMLTEDEAKALRGNSDFEISPSSASDIDVQMGGRKRMSKPRFKSDEAAAPAPPSE